MKRPSDLEQRIVYRDLAREHGCICPSSLGPHVHRPDCPLYSSPAVDAVPSQDHGGASPGPGIETSQDETEPGEDETALQPGALSASPGAGDLADDVSWKDVTMDHVEGLLVDHRWVFDEYPLMTAAP